MKCFHEYFRTDLKKCIKSKRWLTAIPGVALALAFSLESDLFAKDMINGNVLTTYTFATLMAEMLIAYSFCAFSYAGTYLEEREHNYIRYNVIRGNLKSYVLSKTVVIYLSSLAVMILGTVLFLFVCRMRVPWIDWTRDSYESELAGAYAFTVKQGHVLLYCSLYALHMGLVAAALSNLAALCSVFISNTVLVYVIPALAFKLLITPQINDWNIVCLLPPLKTFSNDGLNLLFCIAVSTAVSAAAAIGCYFGLKKKV